MADYYNPKVRVYVTKKEKLPNLARQEGNLIITSEGGELYFDLEDKRIQVVPIWQELT